MITCQRMIFKAFNQLFSLHPNKLTHLVYSQFSSDDGKYQKYEVPFNINRQQYRGYIKKVQKAKQQIAVVQKLEEGQLLPRRKRRIYDRPKHDTNLTNYAVWRLYDPEETHFKLFEHSMQVVAKIQLQPKWVVHAFGKGIASVNNRLSSHREYVFEDNNLSKFILYEYRNTTHYKKNIPDFDYENQEHLRPQMRKTKRIQPEEFWQSEEYFEFRVNCTSYAEYMKFVAYIKETIEERKTKQSYDQFIDKKFGRAMCFNEKEDMQLFQPRTPFIMHVTPQSFEVQKQEKPAGKGKKQKKPEPVVEEAPAPPKFAYNFAGQLDEQYRKQYKPEQKKAKLNDF